MAKSSSSNVLKESVSSSIQRYVLADVTPDIKKISAHHEKGPEGSAEISPEAIEKIKEEAYQDGYREGYQGGEQAGREAGLALAHKEASSLLSSASCLVERLESLRREMMENSESEMVRLAMSIARSVVHVEPLINKEVVFAVAKAAIKQLTARDNIKIRLNPADAEYIYNRKKDLLSSVDSVKELTIEEDKSITSGGCVVDAGLAEVDARLEQQLDEIARVLLKELEGHE